MNLGSSTMPQATMAVTTANKENKRQNKTGERARLIFSRALDGGSGTPVVVSDSWRCNSRNARSPLNAGPGTTFRFNDPVLGGDSELCNL
jgi:hypothetical protein